MINVPITADEIRALEEMLDAWKEWKGTWAMSRLVEFAARAHVEKERQDIDKAIAIIREDAARLNELALEHQRRVDHFVNHIAKKS